MKYNEHIAGFDLTRRYDINDVAAIAMENSIAGYTRREALDLAKEAMQEASMAGIHKIGKTAFNMAVIEYII